MRDCQPSPVDLKNATTSGLYRIDTSNFLLSDLGLPRKECNGTIALSWASVNGCASRSANAAATIAASSSGAGNAIAGCSDVFDIVFHLTTFCSSQADDFSHFASLDKGHKYSMSTTD
jgi:hypothetical protein